MCVCYVCALHLCAFLLSRRHDKDINFSSTVFQVTCMHVCMHTPLTPSVADISPRSISCPYTCKYIQNHRLRHIHTNIHIPTHTHTSREYLTEDHLLSIYEMITDSDTGIRNAAAEFVSEIYIEQDLAAVFEQNKGDGGCGVRLPHTCICIYIYIYVHTYI